MRDMHRRIALLALMLLAAGCRPESALDPEAEFPLPDMSGEWSYEATELRVPGVSSGSCDITGMTLTLGVWEPDGFKGRTSGGTLRCDGQLAFLSAALPEYPIRRGTMAWAPPRHVTEYVSFDISNEKWRHDGSLSADTLKLVVRGDTVRRVVWGDTIRGFVAMTSGSVQLNGRFRAVRRTRR